MDKTIFQKIIDREIPAEIIYEDEKYIAILDIFPKTVGHAILITKEPYVWVYDMPDDAFAEYFVLAKKIGLHIKEKLHATYISFQTWGTDVPHAHIHIVPLYSMTEKYTRTEPNNEELKELGEKLKM
jgi:histidine triad (HIT) family protein